MLKQKAGGGGRPGSCPFWEFLARVLFLNRFSPSFFGHKSQKSRPKPFPKRVRIDTYASRPTVFPWVAFSGSRRNKIDHRKRVGPSPFRRVLGRLKATV
jgi:hypothetical protein